MEQESPPPFRRVVQRRSLELIAGGLGLVAALAWNDAIRGLFDRLFGAARGGLIAQFAYAIVVTAVVVFVTTRVLKRTDG